jgi:hypothetical protein
MAARYMGSKQMAMVIGKTIHLHGTTREKFLSDSRWVRHELCHVLQYRELGLLTFLWKYLWECMRVGYYNNRYEIEARIAERNAAITHRVVII